MNMRNVKHLKGKKKRIDHKSIIRFVVPPFLHTEGGEKLYDTKKNQLNTQFLPQSTPARRE